MRSGSHRQFGSRYTARSSADAKYPGGSGPPVNQRFHLSRRLAQPYGLMLIEHLSFVNTFWCRVAKNGIIPIWDMQMSDLSIPTCFGTYANLTIFWIEAMIRIGCGTDAAHFQ